MMMHEAFSRCFELAQLTIIYTHIHTQTFVIIDFKGLFLKVFNALVKKNVNLIQIDCDENVFLYYFYSKYQPIEPK